MFRHPIHISVDTKQAFPWMVAMFWCSTLVSHYVSFSGDMQKPFLITCNKTIQRFSLLKRKLTTNLTLHFASFSFNSLEMFVSHLIQHIQYFVPNIWCFGVDLIQCSLSNVLHSEWIVFQSYICQICLIRNF